MRLMGFESVPLVKGVEALMLRELTLDLATVVEKGLVSMGRSTWIGSPHGPVEQQCAKDLRAKLEDGREMEWRGFLVYSSDKELVDFLVDRYVPSGDSSIDLLLRQEDPEVARDHLREGFAHRSQQTSLRRGRSWEGVEFVIRRRDMDYLALTRVGRDSSWCMRNEGVMTLVANRLVEYGPHRVPRRAFASLHSRDLTKGETVWFDGDRFGHATAIRHLPATLYRELDESGESVYRAVADSLPSAPLAPLFLLRAPSRAEAASVLADWPKIDPAPPRSDPFFLTDTREPVPLPPGLPVVDDVVEAARIVARMQDGIYVPDDLLPATVVLEDEPRWYLAHRVVA